MEERFVDRRKYKRVESAVDILITVRINDLENEHTVVSGKTVNISANGVLIAYDEAIPVDAPVLLTFFPTDSDELIDVKGRVKRVEKAGEQYNLGIEFIDFKPEQAARLDRLLHQKATAD
jgi:c-di-GMP-binding flagellar brake protein YcgR